jgi:transcriptional regulator with XRE-family HTH domain
MSELFEKLREEFKDKETRRIYVDDFLNTSIATQIKVLREQRGLTQAQLAELAGMRQERISVLEDIDYSAWTINVLRRLAEAFDLRLSVKFESFGSFLYEFESFSRGTLERPSFEDDAVFHGATLGGDATAAYDIDIVAALSGTWEESLEAVKSAVEALITGPQLKQLIEAAVPAIDLGDDITEVSDTTFAVESTGKPYFMPMPELDHTANLPS